MDPSDWRGVVGDRWAAEWRRTDRSFAALNPALLAAILAAIPGDQAGLIDIGCGAGTTSLAVAEACPDATVVGLDLSAALIEAATARAAAAGLTDRCRFRTGDAASLAASQAPVGGFFSRHGVMFFADPVAAFARLAAAAAPGAALVFSCFAASRDNAWATETVPTSAPVVDAYAPGPFAFADPGRVAAILAASGWDAGEPKPVVFRYVAGAGADPISDALAFLSRIGPAARALRQAHAADQPGLLAWLRDVCAAHRDGAEVAFAAKAWLWTAHAMGVA